jgi:TQXA domain-containing protein
MLGGLISFTAAGIAAAAEATTTPVTGKAGVRTDSQGKDISYRLFDEHGNSHDAFRITLAIGNGEPADAYCIDLEHTLKRDLYQETAWKASTVQNLDKVQWILVHSVPNVAAKDVLKAAEVKPEDLAGQDLQLLVYAATQGAIWHFSDDLQVGPHPGDDYSIVKRVYKYLTENAKSEKEPASTLTITPTNATGEIGTKLGPYTVKSSLKSAELSATGGKIVDANGAPVTGPVADGGKFWLTSDTAGKVTVDAKAEGTVPTGRVFTFPAAPDEFQKVILAGKATTGLIAHATGTFTPKVAPSSPAAPTLPVTGAPAVGAAVGGVALLAGGGLLVVMLRRRRIKFTA